MEQNQNKITMLGTQLKQNYNIWNTTHSQLQYLEHNTHEITIFLPRVKGKPLKITSFMVKQNHDISRNSQTASLYLLQMKNKIIICDH